MQDALFKLSEDKKPRSRAKRDAGVMSDNSHTSLDKVGPYSLDTVQAMDCIEGMRALPDRSVDIAIVDPPYNVSKGGNWKWDNSIKLPGFGGDWSKVMASWDNMPIGEYLSFSLSWLSELKRVVRPTGSIWIHGTYHNIGIINFALQLLEIEIINEVVWYKRNSFPNLSGRRLTASHETILWAHTGKKREYFFNYENAKNSSFPEDALKAPGKQMRTVWDIPNNKEREELRYGKHPTQKPIRLIKRMINVSAKPDQICLVPFAGSGSECVAAHLQGLRFIAFENDPEYLGICKKRIEALPKNYLFPVVETESNGKSQGVEKVSTENSQSEITHSTNTIPSLIKWTGSKRSQAFIIAEHIPEHKRYFEPFVGSGAMLYLMARPGAVASDIYKPLVELWRLVQSDPDTLVSNYREQWQSLQNDLPGYFYKVRSRFNEAPNPLDLSFLLRTCVNGIVRFNDAGEFNNSFHLSRPGMNPERFLSIVNEWHRAIKDVRFVCQDYEEILNEAGAGDFAYLDPPYLGNKQRYVKNIDTERFFTVLEALNKRGVKWALSFDGRRGGRDLTSPFPKDLYKRHILIASGNSAVGKVLNGPVEMVEESLYMNY